MWERFYTIELNFLDTIGMRHTTDIIQAITIHIPTGF